jgi:hypothetical protein
MQPHAMQAQEITQYLAELGQELQQRGMQQPIRLLVVGGAFMLLQLHQRPATQDIDVLFKDFDDPAATPFYSSFQAAVRAVAAQHQLAMNWINDVIGDALRDTGPVPAGTLWQTFGPLEVYFPDSTYILALKILANRSKDRADIQVLCQLLGIQTRAQAQQILDQYVDPTIQQAQQVDLTLAILFP